MDLLRRKFSAQSVALANGIPSKRVTDLCNQGLIIGQREPLGRGYVREFSFFNVMEVGLAIALMEIGVRSPGDAFRAAQRFSHTSDGGLGWVGDDAFSDSDPHRWPGLPFHYTLGDTFLCVAGTKSVVALDDAGKLSVSQLAEQLGKASGLIALNVTRIFFEVTGRMAIDPREVLEEAYGEGAR